MNRKEHLLVILMEECAEFQQAIAKVLRFGLFSEYEGVENLQQIRFELNDILAIIAMLNEESIIIDMNVEMMERKKEKVEKYLKLSKELGTLNE